MVRRKVAGPARGTFRPQTVAFREELTGSMAEAGSGTRVFYDDGRLVVRDRDGAELALTPWMEESNAREEFTPEFFDALILAMNDPLAEQVLAEGEPSHERVARVLPRVVDQSFVGDPRRDERFIIQRDGSVDGLLGPLAEMPPAELARDGCWGLVDRRLPLPLLRINEPDGATREQIAVADIGPDGSHRLLVRRQIGEDVQHLTPGGDCADAEGAFADAVIAQWRMVSEFHAHGMALDGGDTLLSDLSASSLWLADLTQRGCHPRYGIGTYDRFKDHGFPPTIIHYGRCLVEWGHFQRAAEVIGCYLDAYVANDGTFVYYGPALSEYGQVLSLCARYVELAGDERWWVSRQSALRRVWGRLLDLRREALADADAPANAHELIPGLPEADYHRHHDQWRQYYYSGDAWTIRGLTDIARVLRRTGAKEEAAAIEAEMEAYRRDLLASVEASSVETPQGIYVPPGPTQTEPLARMTQDRHASYCNYRYLAEMVSAGVLPQRVVRRVLDWRVRHGGELLAMTRFEDSLDDWPVLNWARAMLESGEIGRYQTLLHAHLAHHQTLWLTAPEHVEILPDESGMRRYRAGQVAPCQVVAPQMLRWALAYEPRDEEMLLIAPAVQRSWIEHGLRAQGIPTRRGPVDVAMRVTERGVEVELRLPAGVPEVGVRLPLGPGETLHRADIAGGLMLETADDEVFVQPQGETVEIIGEVRRG